MRWKRYFWGVLFAVLAGIAVLALIAAMIGPTLTESSDSRVPSHPAEPSSTSLPPPASLTIHPTPTVPPTWTSTVRPWPTATTAATPRPTITPSSDDDLTNALVIPTVTGMISPAVTDAPPPVALPPATAQPPPAVSTWAEYLIIPVINLTARVVPVGLDASGNMEAPSGWFDIAWYRYGPKPGSPGSAALAGHLDTNTGAPAAFWNLDQLVPGQQIIYQTASGNQIVFIVEEIAVYPWDQVPLDRVFNRGGQARLALITCGGTWSRLNLNYSHRTIVFARLG